MIGLICTNITKKYVILKNHNGKEIQRKEVYSNEEGEKVIDEHYFKALLLHCTLELVEEETKLPALYNL